MAQKKTKKKAAWKIYDGTKATEKSNGRKKVFVGWLSNHASSKDNETMRVMAYDVADAERLIISKMDKSRFSLSHVLTGPESRKNWA